jgi:hypothetical protein
MTFNNEPVNFHATAIVINEAQFSKFVHEEIHAGPGCSDHLRKRLLADLGDNGLRFAFLAEVRLAAGAFWQDVSHSN